MSMFMLSCKILFKFLLRKIQQSNLQSAICLTLRSKNWLMIDSFVPEFGTRNNRYIIHQRRGIRLMKDNVLWRLRGKVIEASLQTRTSWSWHSRWRWRDWNCTNIYNYWIDEYYIIIQILHIYKYISIRRSEWVQTTYGSFLEGYDRTGELQPR